MHVEAKGSVDLDGSNGSIGTTPNKQRGLQDHFNVNVELFAYVLSASDKTRSAVGRERIKLER